MLLLLAWAALGVALWAWTVRSRVGSVGLPVAYLSGIAILHVPGAAVYLSPASPGSDISLVYEGFRMTSIAASAFVIGTWLIGRYLPMRMPERPQSSMDPRFGILGDVDLGRFLIVLGLVSTLVLIPVVGALPTLSTLVHAFGNTLLAGLCLKIWRAVLLGRRRELRLLLGVAFVFPFFTVAYKGFLGAGIGMVMIVLTFFLSIRRQRLRLHSLLLLPAILFFGLSLYMSYADERTNLRDVVWQGSSTLADRVDATLGIFVNWHWFDYEDTSHLNRIDDRLNQNILVGHAINYVEAGYVPLAQGRTLTAALVSIIPRALWPSKPQIAGGSAFVTEFTGMRFDGSTSVGGGPVFEFYVNFGTSGVFLGMILMGAIIRFVDMHVSFALRRGDQRGFLLWFLPGIAFIGGLSELAIVSAAVLSSFGAAWLIILYVGRRQRSPRVRHQALVK